MARQTTAFDPTDQRTRRRRARVTQLEVAQQFPTPISFTSVGNYERGDHALPLEFTGQDYEDALAKAIAAKRGGK